MGEKLSKALDVWKQDLQTKSKHTREVYNLYFNRFLERWNISAAEDLYEMRKADIESKDTRDHQRIERMVKVYMSEMLDEGYAAGSCRQVSKAVGSFFESQGLPLNIKSKDKPKGAYNGQRLALVEHIQDMWDYAPTESKLKTRAQLMFMKDSGLRISDIANLNVGDYLEAESVEDDGEIFKVFWPKETEKTSDPAYIHIGPEAIETLEAYLNERQGQGLIIDPETPLFLNRFGKRFTASSIGMVFLRIGKRIGKKLSAHSLRKFHTTMLQSAGMHDSWIKRLQGKSVRGSMGPYTRPEETGQLTESYIKAYLKLRIFGEQASSQQIQEQADELEKLRYENEKLKDELEKRDDRLRKVEDRLQKIVLHLGIEVQGF